MISSSLMPVSQYNIYANNVLSVKRLGSIFKVTHCRKLRRSGYDAISVSSSDIAEHDYSFEGKRDNNVARARTAVWAIALSNCFDLYTQTSHTGNGTAP